MRPAELSTSRERNMSESITVPIALAACLCGSFTIAGDEQTDKSVRPLQLNVDKNGRILVLNQRLTVDELKPVLTQILKTMPQDRRPPVELNVHPDSRHEHVVGLTDLCKALKLTKITLQVTKESSRRITDKPVSKQTLKEAVERVESLDGDVHSNDGVVVQISFHKKKIGDAELKLIPVFRGLISLSLTGTEITDAGRPRLVCHRGHSTTYCFKLGFV